MEKIGRKRQNIRAKMAIAFYFTYIKFSEIPFIRTDVSKNHNSGKFKYRKKEHVANIKYNKKATVFSRLHQEEIVQMNYNEIKIIIPSISIIHPYKKNHTDSNT